MAGVVLPVETLGEFGGGDGELLADVGQGDVDEVLLGSGGGEVVAGGGDREGLTFAQPEPAFQELPQFGVPPLQWIGRDDGSTVRRVGSKNLSVTESPVA